MAGKPEGYVDVAERIAEFREKYPDGSLQQQSIEFVRDFANKNWVVFTAAAYRSPDDLRPGVGTAWEPVPGPTNFTRDSEVQNAETAAWGRALVATLAVDAKQIASKQEVQNRTAAPVVEAVPPEVVADWVSVLSDAASMAQLQKAWEEAGAAGVTGNRDVITAKDKRKGELPNG